MQNGDASKRERVAVTRFSPVAAGVPIFSLPEARIRSFLRVLRRHVSRALKALSRESSLRCFIPPESLTSEKKRERRKPPLPPFRGEKFLLRRGCDHVQEARKLFPSFFPTLALFLPQCHPRSSKVNLIQKRRDLVSRFPRALSFSFSLFLPRTAMTVLESAESTHEVPISVTIPRLVAEICPYLLYSSAACACAARCIAGIRRVQCKNCAPGTFARGKSTFTTSPGECHSVSEIAGIA